MKMPRLSNLLKKDLKIVEKRRVFFLVPLVVLLIGIIAGVIFHVNTGSAFNFGMDFTGGYTITVRAGTTINDQNYADYSAKIETLVTEYRYEYNQTEYPVDFEGIQRLGSGSETSMRIEYRADKSIPSAQRDKIMEELSADLVETINDVVGYLTPGNVSIVKGTATGNIATVTYDKPVRAHVDDGSLATLLQNNGITASNFVFLTGDDSNPQYNVVQFNFSGDHSEADIQSAAAINVFYAAQAISGDMISGTVSNDLIYNAILAVIIALLLMLIYIFIRFEFASGIAAVIALLHDVSIMFILMVVFHVQISSTFIAALITVLGYSINNTIIIFDRVRENRKTMLSSGMKATASDVANKSIKESLTRTVYTTFTTFVMIGMVALVCAIGGIVTMVDFALPIMFGMVAGFFSAVFIAPSLWVVFKRNSLGTLNTGKVQPVRAKTVASGAEDSKEALEK